LDKNEENYIHRLFNAIVKVNLPTWKDVTAFSDRSGIKINTLKDLYFKDGKAGVQTMDKVLKELLQLDDAKMDQIIRAISNTEPVSKAIRVFSSIDAPEDKRLYYALIAKSVWEIETKLEKSSDHPGKDE